MSHFKIEMLRGAPADQSLSAQVWIGETLGGRELLVKLLSALDPEGVLLLEFWHPSDALRERLTNCQLTLEVVCPGIEVTEMRGAMTLDLVLAIQSEPFGIWSVASKSEAWRAMLERRPHGREQGMPDESMYIVASLYDDNFEVYASGDRALKVREFLGGIRAG